MFRPGAPRDLFFAACGRDDEGTAAVPARRGRRDGQARVLDVQPVAA